MRRTRMRLVGAALVLTWASVGPAAGDEASPLSPLSAGDLLIAAAVGVVWPLAPVAQVESELIVGRFLIGDSVPVSIGVGLSGKASRYRNPVYDWGWTSAGVTAGVSLHAPLFTSANRVSGIFSRLALRVTAGAGGSYTRYQGEAYHVEALPAWKPSMTAAAGINWHLNRLVAVRIKAGYLDGPGAMMGVSLRL